MREIVIGFADVSTELTNVSCDQIAEEFGGFFLARGYGVYTMDSGEIVREQSVRLTIGTNKTYSEVVIFVARFARLFCEVGKQESIYFRDKQGDCFIVDKEGKVIR